jgi:hypothetical protein
MGKSPLRISVVPKKGPDRQEYQKKDSMGFEIDKKSRPLGAGGRRGF